MIMFHYIIGCNKYYYFLEDLTFIHTWHVYGQLKRELEKFSKVINLTRMR